MWVKSSYTFSTPSFLQLENRACAHVTFFSVLRGHFKPTPTVRQVFPETTGTKGFRTDSTYLSRILRPGFAADLRTEIHVLRTSNAKPPFWRKDSNLEPTLTHKYILFRVLEHESYTHFQNFQDDRHDTDIYERGFRQSTRRYGREKSIFHSIGQSSGQSRTDFGWRLKPNPQRILKSTVQTKPPRERQLTHFFQKPCHQWSVSDTFGLRP